MYICWLFFLDTPTWMKCASSRPRARWKEAAALASLFFGVPPKSPGRDEFIQPSQRTTNTHSEEWNGTNIIYRTFFFFFFPPCLWSLNIVNSRVKVCVVVINKHAQRDLLFDKRSRSNCHLTERFWELPWSGVLVAMETDKQRFLSGFPPQNKI